MNRNERRLAKKQSGAQKRPASQTITGLFEEALRLHQAGRLAEAEPLYHRVLTLDPAHSDTLHLLGVMACQVGRHTQAVDLIEQAVRVAPDVAFYHNNLGIALKELGRFDEAVARFEQAITLQPDYAEAHNNLGIAVQALGRFDQAAAHYGWALSLVPDYADAHNNLGVTLKALGRFDEAAERYRRAIALKPDFAEAHNNLGVILTGQGRFDEAVASYERSLAVRPDYAEAHNNLGNVLKALGRLEQAVACYQRATALRPDYVEAHSNLGVSLYALATLGRRDQAVAWAGDWLRANPDQPIAGHMVAALIGSADQLPSRASDGYVETVFDFFAPDFDGVLARVGYRGPAMVAEVIGRALPAATDLDVLDIGCGTGLAGVLLRPLARTLTGVDLSRAMLARAAGRRLYDALYHSEVTAFLLDHVQAFDLVVATDVLIYFGDVAPLLSAAVGALCPGGMVAFTVEQLADDSGDWCLLPHGRYCHSERYLRRCLDAAGLAVVQVGTGVLRTENGQDVGGLVMLAALPAQVS